MDSSRDGSLDTVRSGSCNFEPSCVGLRCNRYTDFYPPLDNFLKNPEEQEWFGLSANVVLPIERRHLVSYSSIGAKCLLVLVTKSESSCIAAVLCRSYGT